MIIKQLEQLPPLDKPITITYFDFTNKQIVSLPTTIPTPRTPKPRKIFTPIPLKPSTRPITRPSTIRSFTQQARTPIQTHQVANGSVFENDGIVEYTIPNNVLRITGTRFIPRTSTDYAKGNFDRMIQDPKAKNCLFIFNDNIQDYNNNKSGGGNASIRPFKTQHKSWGIPTGGTSGSGGFQDLDKTLYDENGDIGTDKTKYKSAKHYIDKAIKDIIDVINKRNDGTDPNNSDFVNELIYSTEHKTQPISININGTPWCVPDLGSSIFSVNDNVKQYILKQLYNIPYNIPYNLGIRPLSLSSVETPLSRHSTSRQFALKPISQHKISKEGVYYSLLPNKSRGMGIYNIGSTCYANAAFQLLACIGDFITGIMSATLKQKKDTPANQNALIFLTTIFNEIKVNPNPKLEHIVPNENEMNKLISVVSPKDRNNNLLIGHVGTQNDSQEFLSAIITWLQENTNMKIDYLQWFTRNLNICDNRTLFFDIREIEGIVWPVNIENLNEDSSINEYIKNYVIKEEEKILDNDGNIAGRFGSDKCVPFAYKPNGIDIKDNAIKFKTLYSFDKYIIIQLNIFSSINGIQNKIYKKYTILPELDIVNHSKADLTKQILNIDDDGIKKTAQHKYKLIGYIAHSGGKYANSGHYVFYKYQDSDKCLVFNDPSVYSIDSYKMTNINRTTGDPYIFLFERIDSEENMSVLHQSRPPYSHPYSHPYPSPSTYPYPSPSPSPSPSQYSPPYLHPYTYQSQIESLANSQNRLENSLLNQIVHQLSPLVSQPEDTSTKTKEISVLSRDVDISEYVNYYLNIKDANKEEIKKKLIEFIKCQLGKSTTSYQRSSFSNALAEIQNCKKKTCWMWYVIPSRTDYSGSSEISKYFCINNPKYSPVMVSHYLMIPYLKKNYETIIHFIYNCILLNNKINKILPNDDDVRKFYSSINEFLNGYNELRPKTKFNNNFIEILTELNKLNHKQKTVQFSKHTKASGGSYKLTKKNNGKLTSP